MLPQKIASRYAEALFGLAQQHGTIEEWERGLALLASVITETPDFAALLTHPEVPLARKQAVLEHAFAGRIAPEVLAVLTLLIKRGHDPEMDVVHDMYIHLWHTAQRVVPVTITSALPLSDMQVSALTTVITTRTGRTVLLQQQVDPDILSGLIITMGDRVIDASARTALAELRTMLVNPD